VGERAGPEWEFFRSQTSWAKDNPETTVANSSETMEGGMRKANARIQAIYHIKKTSAKSRGEGIPTVPWKDLLDASPGGKDRGVKRRK